MRVAAKNAECYRDDPGIDRRVSRGRSGIAAKGRAEAVSGGEGIGDAAELPSKAEVRVGGAEPVGVRQGDIEHANDKSYEHHPKRRLEPVAPSGVRRSVDGTGWRRGLHRLGSRTHAAREIVPNYRFTFESSAFPGPTGTWCDTNFRDLVYSTANLRQASRSHGEIARFGARKMMRRNNGEPIASFSV